MIRATLLLWVAVMASSLSNVLTRRGMVAVGPLEDYRPGPLLRYGLAAAVFLGEQVSPIRWLGIALIAAGVALLMDSWEHPQAPLAA